MTWCPRPARPFSRSDVARRQQVTIGSLDGIDIDTLASFLRQAFDCHVVVGDWENGIPEGMIVLERNEEQK